MTGPLNEGSLPCLVQLGTKENIIPGAKVNTRLGPHCAYVVTPQCRIHNPRTLWAISHTAAEDDLHDQIKPISVTQYTSTNSPLP